ncbi:MAG: winged helix-turn-helix transcriptional regulator [Candidatus Thorarchaeota archaeon]
MQKQQEILENCLPIQVKGNCLKPLLAYLKLISRKWMLLILMLFPSDSTPLRYSELQNRVNQISSEKISDTTLSQRLNELTTHSIIVRKQYNEIPLRVEYQLSRNGIALQESLHPLLKWAVQTCHNGL